MNQGPGQFDLRLFRKSLLEKANDGHYHAAADAATKDVADDSANIQAGSSAGGYSDRVENLST